MNLWQMLLAIAVFAILFALWTASESTRTMLVFMGIALAVATVTVVCLLRMFEMLGTMAYKSRGRDWAVGLSLMTLMMVACALVDCVLLIFGFYLLGLD
jgi:hypothetical protein